jgi:hypothetical protein
MTSPALQDIVALLGCPAAGNPAQYLFERAIAAAGLDWRFLTFDVLPERLARALGGVDAMGESSARARQDRQDATEQDATEQEDRSDPVTGPQATVETRHDRSPQPPARPPILSPPPPHDGQGPLIDRG